MSSTTDELWTKRGQFGWWTSPTGARYWLFPSDYPMDIDGVDLIVRVVEPPLVSLATMLGMAPECRDVWVAVVDLPGAFQHVATIAGGEGLDVRVELEVRCWWEKRGKPCA